MQQDENDKKMDNGRMHGDYAPDRIHRVYENRGNITADTGGDRK